LPTQVLCNGRCVDPKTDDAFCGATDGCGDNGGSAGTACTSGQTCTGGACQASCLPTQVLCNGRCVDPKTDNAFCGATDGCGDNGGSAGTPCPDGQMCSNGTCSATCGSPLTKCTSGGGSTYCADTAHDPSNCGGCGTACSTAANAAVTCSGSCGYACHPGYADCNAEANDGCEADTLTDENNCGGCGNVCGANQFCHNGTCGLPTCADLVTTANVWGRQAKGLALASFTNGTFEWLGCANVSCSPNEFFCTDEATGIFFGSTGGTIRAVVDPGNAGGDSYPTSFGGCCSAANPRDVCNGPRSDNDGVGGLNAGNALCRALGYTSGTVVVELTGNSCPRPYATNANGSDWTSNWDRSTSTYGNQFRCIK
jgi:hypothetical protein